MIQGWIANILVANFLFMYNLFELLRCEFFFLTFGMVCVLFSLDFHYYFGRS